jgi:hypothetical protein
VSDTVARNEALFRAVNERVADVNQQVGPSERTEFICECGNAGCIETVTLTLEQYERVRAHELHFVVRAGHERLDVESVIFAEGDFVVVQKHEGESRIARETDPRDA